MSVEINWTKILDETPDTPVARDLIPPDVYVCTVEKAEAGLSKTGNSKIELTFVVDDPDKPDFKGRKVWGRINFATNSPQSMAISIQQLAEFGITRKWLAEQEPSQDQIARKLTGEKVKVKVAHREWEGQQYYDIRGYSAVTKDDVSDPF